MGSLTPGERREALIAECALQRQYLGGATRSLLLGRQRWRAALLTRLKIPLLVAGAIGGLVAARRRPARDRSSAEPGAWKKLASLATALLPPLLTFVRGRLSREKPL